MLLQHVRKDLQGKALLLAALLAPLLWLHLGVGQVGVVVLVVCQGEKQEETTVTAVSVHTGSVSFLNIKIILILILSRDISWRKTSAPTF